MLYDNSAAPGTRLDGTDTVEGAAASPAPALAKGAHMAVVYEGVAYQAEDEAADVRAGAIAAIAAVAASLAGCTVTGRGRPAHRDPRRRYGASRGR